MWFYYENDCVDIFLNLNALNKKHAKEFNSFGVFVCMRLMNFWRDGLTLKYYGRCRPLISEYTGHLRQK